MSKETEQKAADLVAALKKKGFDLSIGIAIQVIADMHQMAKTRRLKAIWEATQ